MTKPDKDKPESSKSDSEDLTMGMNRLRLNTEEGDKVKEAS